MDYVVSFVLQMRDSGSAPAVRAVQVLERSFKSAGDAAKSASSAAISSFQKLANARETLGIRSERTIQREIQLTEASYNRLSKSGQASARELARAQDAARKKVAELRAEMEVTSRVGSRLRMGAAAIAGVGAAGAVLARPVQQTMAYDRQLANLANTAYAGKDMGERRTGMRTLDQAIQAAVRTGGGTREGAMGTLDKLVGSGAFEDVGEAIKLLPTLTKAGTAANADPSDLADIAIRAKQNFGIKDTGLALDQALRAGQLGGFELKDMAKWLPQQMAAARMSGMTGDAGFRTLLAANQASAITAGSKDEAGNNLVNLLTKINSADTSKDAAKQGIDLAGTLVKARSNGVNSLDAFTQIVENVVGKDKNYQALKAKAANSTGDEQKAAYASMGDILEGNAIGKIIQDRQALMALIGITNNKEYMGRVQGGLANAKGATDSNFGLVAETASFKTEQLANEKAIAMQTALDKVNPSLGGLAEGVTSLMREWPGFSAAIVAATTALAALAAAAGASALTSVLGGGKLAGAGAVAGRVGMLGRAGLGAVAAGGSAAAISTAGLLAAGAAGYGVGTMINGGINKLDQSAGTKIGDSIGYMLHSIMAALGDQDSQRYIKLDVDVKNGNIVAAVNEANSRQARRN